MLLITVYAPSSLNNLKLADRELSRRDEVTKMLEYIQRQLGQLNVLKDLPRTYNFSPTLENRALDVKSGVLTYIAVHICREGNQLGILGKFSVPFETYVRKYRNSDLQG